MPLEQGAGENRTTEKEAEDLPLGGAEIPERTGPDSHH